MYQKYTFIRGKCKWEFKYKGNPYFLGKSFFIWTFLGSILWIAAFSYLMVWWATVAGDTAGIPPAVSETKHISENT